MTQREGQGGRLGTSLAWGLTAGGGVGRSPRWAKRGFLGRPMTRQNPGRGWAPGLPTPNPSPISPRCTDLSYSDRVRNMARAGEGGSGYAGTLRANTSSPAPRSRTPPQNRGPAPNCACARDPFGPPPCACLLLVVGSSR